MPRNGPQGFTERARRTTGAPDTFHGWRAHRPAGRPGRRERCPFFYAVPTDAGRLTVLGWCRRPRGGWLVTVVRVDARALLSPDKGEKDQHGEQAEPPPGEDPGAPGDRERRNGDRAQPGARPCPQQHPRWLGALRQPGHDRSMPTVSVLVARADVRVTGGSLCKRTRGSGNVARPGRSPRRCAAHARAHGLRGRSSPLFDRGAKLEPAVERVPDIAVASDVSGDRGRVEIEVNGEMRHVSHRSQSRCVGCLCASVNVPEVSAPAP